MRGLGYVLIFVGTIGIGLGPMAASPMSGSKVSPAVGFLIGLAILFIGIGMVTTGEKQVFDRTAAALEETDLRGCPACGGKAFTWGNVVSYAPVRFRKGVGMGKPVLARQCDQCGHIDLFTKTNAR